VIVGSPDPTGKDYIIRFRSDLPGQGTRQAVEFLCYPFIKGRKNLRKNYIRIFIEITY